MCTVCLCVATCTLRKCFQRSEESVGSSGTGVTHSCKPPNVRKKIQVLGKSSMCT